jgi:hypothetical protein
MQKPSLGRIVHYRGRLGFFAPRAAIVTATIDSLDPRGVESGQVEALDSDMHVHLWVYSPGTSGGFSEFNVPFSEVGQGEAAPGSWYWPARV